MGKVQRSLEIVIVCENVAPGATDALQAIMKVGTSDDPAMVKSVSLNEHALTSAQATALTNLCNAVANTIKNSEGIP